MHRIVHFVYGCIYHLVKYFISLLYLRLFKNILIFISKTSIECLALLEFRNKSLFKKYKYI